VINDLSIALMPTGMIEKQRNAKDLQMILRTFHPDETPIYAVMPYYKKLGLKQRAMIELFKRKASSLLMKCFAFKIIL
jgi:DNA-binding transcriptional LysR family regulator